MGWHVDEEIDLSRSTDLHKNFSLYWHIGGALHPRAISYFNATEIILNSTQCECQSKLLDQLAKVRENWSKLEVDKITRIALSCYVAACVAIVELATGLDANSAKEFLLHAEAYAVTATKSRSHATIVRDEDFVYRFETYPQYNLTAEQQKEYLRIYDQQIPAWFNELPEWERNHLKTILEPVRTGSVGINEILHLLPCQYRKLPGLANFYRNRFVLAGLDGYEIAHLDSYSSSVPIPIDVKDENDRRRLALQNVTQLLGEGQVLNERLLDYREHWRLMSHFQFPLLFASKLSPFKSGVPDPEKTSRVLGERSAIIEKFRGVSYDIAGSKAVLLPMDINHAVNRWRRSHFNALTHSEKRRSFGGDDAGLEEMMVLFLGDLARKAGIGLKSVDLQTTLNEFRSFLADSESKEKLVGKFGKRYSQLLMMIDAVEQYVRCGDKTSEDADLYRLALEKVASPGLRYGHCKSGKDREKMSDMYSAALFATYHD